MPQYDFNSPMTFMNALEQFALAHQCVMVALRNEVNFGEDRSQAVLNGANLFCSILEDTHIETVELTNQLERRVSGFRET